MRWIKALIQKLKQLITGTYDVYSGHVQDKVRFDGALTLYVDAEAGVMVRSIADAQNALLGVKETSTEEDAKAAALRFAAAIFGGEQAESLMEFYHGDAACVLGVCGKYLTERLGRLITKAQKRGK